MGLDVYTTPQDDAQFCEEESVNLLGKWSVELPQSSNEDDRSILYTMKFGTVELLHLIMALSYVKKLIFFPFCLVI